MPQNTVAPGALASPTADVARAIEPCFRNALPHFLPLAIFPLIFMALLYGGWWIVAPFAFFMLAGPLDIAFGDDERNMDPYKTPEKRLFWHNLPVWCWAFLWPPILVFGLWQILVAGQFSLWECILLAVTLTGEAQAVFIVGHELIHRRSAWERRLGEFLLASTSYPQYATEHIYIHHAMVGTPMDVGSAPKGMSFWRYFPREVASNLTGSWRVARERLARRGLPVWHYDNQFWRYGFETLFWYGLVFWMGGIWAVLAYAVLCLGTVFSMKISNYMQHYGLRRVRRPNGRFEKVQPRHSWNANYKFSNWMFYNMQRHPDHHAAASRQYPLLQQRGADESPQLPGSYAQMFNLAVRPKRWFEKMDPLVDEWRAHFYPEIDDWSAYDSPVSAARPEAFDAIVEIFDAAPRLADWIERNPELLDSLKDREFTDLDLPRGFGPDARSEAVARRGLTRLYWTREFDAAEMKERIAEIPVQNASDTVETVRNWSNDKAFQIGMHTLRGNLSPSEAGVALSNLAEASIATVLSAVADEFADGGDRVGAAAFLLGGLASGEAAPGASIDILFVHDGGQPADGDALCRRFSEALAGLSNDSMLFAPVLPGWQEGVALPLCDLEDYCQKVVSSGEDPDLTRARYIFETGAYGICERFDEVRRGILAEHSPDDELCETSGIAAASGLASFVERPGGLRDVERAIRFLRLKQASGDGPAPGAESLAEAATLWRNLQGILRLVGEEGFAAEEAGPKVKTIIASSCGTDNFEALAARVEDTASRAAAAIAALAGKDARPAGSGGASPPVLSSPA